MLKNTQKIDVWVTSTGRIDVLTSTIASFIEKCTYPNYEFIIIHSQMTEVSNQFFALEYINEEATEKYLKELPEKFPNIKFKLFIQPFKLLGLTYAQLLKETDKYYINIEDDLRTVIDPCKQLIDNIKLLQADPKLLGIRMDLRDETVLTAAPDFLKPLRRKE
jgi:hypothetical protein